MKPGNLLIVIIGVVLMAVLPGSALLELLTVGSIMGACLYGGIVILYLSVRKRLGQQEDAFDLGRFEVPRYLRIATGPLPRTASGKVLGTTECIGVADALRTITLGAAYTLRLDGEIGSIEAGKRADFAVLEDDPLEIGAERLKDVRIWGTVQGGRVFPAAEA